MSGVSNYLNKKTKEINNNNGSYDSRVFFKPNKDLHVIRIVGDFVQINKHWIAPSSYSKIKIFEESCFQGEKDSKLPMQIACADWDNVTESKIDCDCALCSLSKAANHIIFNEAKTLEKSTLDEIKEIRRSASAKTRFLVPIIDRDDKDFKGIKVAEFSTDVINDFYQIVKDIAPDEINDVEKGVDIKLTKTVGKNKVVSYKASLVLTAGSVKKTPLSEEEKAYPQVDVRKYTAKTVSNELLLSKMAPEYVALIESVKAGGKAKTDPF